MPTFQVLPSFWNDYAKLTPQEKALFARARRDFIEDLRNLGGQRFRPSLRVHRVQMRTGVYEMSWDGNGRATFEFGAIVILGEPHIIWRHIGDHSILNNP